jgi:micrococcal nuclease
MRTYPMAMGLIAGLLCIIATLSCVEVETSASSSELACTDCPLIPVERVIDRDTFDSSYGRVHLYGVDAPERGDQCFREATTRLRELAGEDVRVELGPREMDSFGRVLAYVYTEAGDSVDETLVREGLAWAWTRDEQHRDVLITAERDAREQGTGCLW